MIKIAKLFGIFVALFIIVIFVDGNYSRAAAGVNSANCRLSVPPAQSGEDGLHGKLIKIYPRSSSMGGKYSGCQTVWALDGKRWVPIMIGIFENGKVVKMKSPTKPRDPVEQCLLKSGILVRGDEDICSALEVFPYSSAPAGCLKKSKNEDINQASCAYD